MLIDFNELLCVGLILGVQKINGAKVSDCFVEFTENKSIIIPVAIG